MDILQVGLGHIGISSTNKENFEYAIVVTFYFAEWVEAIPTRRITQITPRSYFGTISSLDLTYHTLWSRTTAKSFKVIKSMVICCILNQSRLAHTSLWTGWGIKQDNIQDYQEKTFNIKRSLGNWAQFRLMGVSNYPSSSTGASPFSLCYRAKAVMPIEYQYPTSRSDVIKDLTWGKTWQYIYTGFNINKWSGGTTISSSLHDTSNQAKWS